MKNRQKAIIAILLSGAFGGGNAVFNKLGLSEIPNFLFIFLRFFLTTLILWPFFPKSSLKVNSDLKYLFAISILPVINILLFTFGVVRTSANIAMMIYTATPITVALLSLWHLKEKYRLWQIAGIILGFTGTLSIVFLPVIETKTLLKSDLTGNLAIFIGMFFFSIYSVLSKKMHQKYSPTFITFVFAVANIIITSVFAAFEVYKNPLWWTGITISGWTGLFYVGIFGSIALYLLFQYAIKYSTPLIGSLNSYLQPISGVVWAALILGEKVTLGFLLASAATFIGVYLVTKN